MNNRNGLLKVLESSEALNLIARSIDPCCPQVMQDATMLLAALCLVQPSKEKYHLQPFAS